MPAEPLEQGGRLLGVAGEDAREDEVFALVEVPEEEGLPVEEDALLEPRGDLAVVHRVQPAERLLRHAEEELAVRPHGPDLHRPARPLLEVARLDLPDEGRFHRQLRDPLGQLAQVLARALDDLLPLALLVVLPPFVVGAQEREGRPAHQEGDREDRRGPERHARDQLLLGRHDGPPLRLEDEDGAIARVTIEPRARKAKAATAPPCMTAAEPARTAAAQGSAARSPFARRSRTGRTASTRARTRSRPCRWRGLDRPREKTTLRPIDVGQEGAARGAIAGVRLARRARRRVELAEVQKEQLARRRVPHRAFPCSWPRASRSAETAR